MTLSDGVDITGYVFIQNAVVYSSRIHALGRYVFIIHYHQPLHPTYPVQVYINAGRIWQGKTNLGTTEEQITTKHQ